MPSATFRLRHASHVILGARHVIKEPSELVEHSPGNAAAVVTPRHFSSMSFCPFASHADTATRSLSAQSSSVSAESMTPLARPLRAHALNASRRATSECATALMVAFWQAAPVLFVAASMTASSRLAPKSFGPMRSASNASLTTLEDVGPKLGSSVHFFVATSSVLRRALAILPRASAAKQSSAVWPAGSLPCAAAETQRASSLASVFVTCPPALLSALMQACWAFVCACAKATGAEVSVRQTAAAAAAADR